MNKIYLVALTFLLAAGMSFVACDNSDDKSDDVKATADIAAGDVQEDVAAQTDAAVPESEIEPEEEVRVVEEDLGPPDLEPPVSTFAVEPYTAFQGIADIEASWWSDDVGVTNVEVYVDEQLAGEIDLVTNQMDTTAQAPGKHQLFLKIYDGAGNMTQTDEVTVMLAGPGQFLPFEDGFEYDIVPGWKSHQQPVFDFSEEVEDTKGHVTVPAARKKAVCWAMWDEDVAWDMGLDIGTGVCPHKGVKLASDDLKAKQGWMEVVYEDEAGADLSAEVWFAHLRYTDGLEHKGGKITYHVLFWVGP